MRLKLNVIRGLLILVTLLLISCLQKPETDSQKKMEAGSLADVFMGDWTGVMTNSAGKESPIVAQVIPYADGNYTINLYREFNRREPALAQLTGKLQERKLKISGKSADGSDWIGLIEGKEFTGEKEGVENVKFSLQQIQRLSPTLGLSPTSKATILFDGNSLEAWQSLPDPVGYIDLAKHIGGNDAVAYLQEMLWSDSDQKVILYLGSDDGIKVWLNQKLIHQKNAQRGATPAQDTVQTSLTQGWNTLLLKINNGDGGWGAFARLTGEDGTVLGSIAEKDLQNTATESTRAALEKNNHYLTLWQVAGPFRRSGMNAAQLFDEVFEPEQTPDKVAWQNYQVSDKVKHAEWKIIEGAMEVNPGKGSIVSRAEFKDTRLHIEFRSPFMPEVTGQKRGNSGVYLQGRYEIQVLDSYGLDGLDNECGGIYQVARPKVNMCAPPGQWQTYDIEFHAARFDASGNKAMNTRITVMHNGVAIHENLEIPGPTGGALDVDETKPGPLMLQDHGDKVQYRNIWMEELTQ